MGRSLQDAMRAGELGWLRIVWLSVWLLAWPGQSAAITFVNIADQSGIEGQELANGHGSGMAAADFDDDGDIDIFLPTEAGEADQLFRNLGNGQFEEVAAQLGLASTTRSRAALWFDYDADHRLDLLVSSDCYLTTCIAGQSSLRLYRQNQSGNFIDVTVEAGLSMLGHTRDEHHSGAAAGDVNGDGYLDLVTGFWLGTLHLYLNQGDGSFTDVSLASGLDAAVLGYWQPVLMDFNADGLLDIYTSVDFGANRLWINQGLSNGMPLFQELAAAAGCDNAMNDMGVALGDFDEDGDPDLYISNIFRVDYHNVLLRNDSTVSTPACTEMSVAAQVDNGGWGWGVTFLDVNNNTLLDLAETNGWKIGGWEQPIRLFINQGGSPVTFADQAAAAGLTDTAWGSALLAVDYDRDGDLDLIENLPTSSRDGNPGTLESVALYQNQLAAGLTDSHYLVIRPRMSGRNARAIGSRITAQLGSRTLTRWITAGGSFLGQEPAEAFFGLGSATQADQITIFWPNGDQTVLTDVAADQIHTVINGSLLSDSFD